MIKRKADLLIEVSWEVCNKVGGINTVLRSKAGLMNEFYPDYTLIGPFVPDKAKFDFTEKPAPENLVKIFDELKNEGIACHYGHWSIKPEPKAILIDFSGFLGRKNEIKKFLWDKYKIDSLNSNWDFEEPVIFGYAAGMLIEKIVQQSQGKKCVAHFHEWMVGSGLLYLKSKGEKKAGTVFTTHATILGRTICGSNENLYEFLESMDPDEEARKHGMQDKHLTEKACAQNADVFTTVSEITAIEAEKILGRKADVLLFNGLEADKFPTFEEVSIKHRKCREVLRKFVSYLFFPHYSFDLHQTLFFFIVGRYEYKNKGIDIMIKALQKLNDRMKAEKSKKNVVVFFWIPREVGGAKAELSQNKLNYDMIRHFVRDNYDIIESNIITNIMKSTTSGKGEEAELESGIFTDEFKDEIRKLKVNFFKPGNPLLVTHNLPDEWNDAIIRDFVQAGLDNREDDKVKVIFYPVYLTGIDGLTDLSYYDAMVGCHFGLFPSYYEPWGYTPLESAALGVPSLTTDLSGFGRFLQSKGKSEGGIYVLNRLMRGEEDVVNDFTGMLYNYTSLRRMGRVNEKIKAKELSMLADWHIFIEQYYKAHNIAVEKMEEK